MFAGSSTVRTFVVPHVCGTNGQRYFLGKHGQKKKKSQGSPSAWPWRFLGPIIRFSFECISFFKFSSCSKFHSLGYISDLMHDLNGNFLSPQSLMLMVIQSAILMWIITSPSSGHSPRLIIGFACLSLAFPYTSCFRFHGKRLLCPPQRPPSPPLCWCSWHKLRLYIPSPASAQERPQRRVTGPTGKPRGRFTSHTFVTTNRAQQGVASEPRTSGIRRRLTSRRLQ